MQRNVQGRPGNHFFVLLLWMQDTAWLDIYLSEVPHVVYQIGDPGASLGAQHATLANKGNEAMAYLQFILDYWERLPASVVFLHGHRCGRMLAHAPAERMLWGADTQCPTEMCHPKRKAPFCVLGCFKAC